MKRYKRYCIAAGCRNSNNCLPDLSFFSLPKDPEKRKKWLLLIGREDLLNLDEIKYKSYQVCTAHFNKSAIIEKIIRKLKANAMPNKVSQSKSNSTGTETKKVRICNKKSTQAKSSKASPRKRKLSKSDTEIREPKPKLVKIEVVNIKQELDDSSMDGS